MCLVKRLVAVIALAAAIGGVPSLLAQPSGDPPPAKNLSSSRSLLVAPMLATPGPLLPAAVLQRRRATVPGLVIGGLVGVAAGLIFVHTSCNEDPCIDVVYPLGAIVGGAVFGGIGAFIGSKVTR